MTDTPDSSAESSVRSFTSAGELLRLAREKRRLTLKTAAQELHLDSWMLEALENDNFKALGAPVFAKGHLRKYANWLGISPDDVLVAYYRDKDTPETPPLVVSRATRQQPHRTGSWKGTALVFFVLAAVGAGLYAWLNAPTEQPESVSVSADDQASLPLPLPEPGVSAEPLTGSTGQSVGQSVGEVSVAQPEPEVRLAPGMGELLLVFNEDSWADVRDRDGNSWFKAVVPADTVETLTGRFPFTVFLGNASGVYIAVDGQQFDIAEEDKRRNGTARFTIGMPAPADR